MVSFQLGPCQFGVLMIETRNIETAPGMISDVSLGGPEAGPLVLMLHGWGTPVESSYLANAPA